MRTRVGVLVVAVLLTVTGAGCGGGTSETSADPSEEPGPTFDTAEPSAETTDATESADSSDGDGSVAVELPGLPIGGGTTVVSDTLQCVDVAWSGPPDLPEGLGISLGGIAFQPAEDFAESSEPCPGDLPPCLSEGFQLFAGGLCAVGVTWTGSTLEDERLLSFTSGAVSCPPDQLATCTTFRDEIAAAGPQVISLDPAPSEFETEETEQTEEPTSDVTEDPTSEGTTAPTPEVTDDETVG